MYGAIMCFDKETEGKIQGLWDEMAASAISTYHFDKNGQQKRPHITLADYHDLDLEQYKNQFQTFLEGQASFDVDLSIVGSFPTGGTLFLTPVMSNRLFQFHNDYHRVFASFQDQSHSFYLPGRWVPHCTLTNHLDPIQLTKAFDFISKSFQPIKTRISEIVLIRLIYKDDVVMGSEPIISYQF